MCGEMEFVMIKVGLIGAGYMGGMHLACYQALAEEGVKITAVADIIDEKARSVAEKFNAVIYSNGMELIENADVDVIDICLPTYLHTNHAVEAMKKGKPVFIEKPVCLNEEEADLLLRTEKETGVPVMVGQCIRMWSEYVWLKKTVDHNIYGDIVSGVFKRVSPLPTWAWNNWLLKPEYSGSVALDMHIHDVDYIRYIMGEPEKISATASRDKDGVIEQIFATFTFQKAVAFAEACWDYPASFPFCMEYRIKFEKATAVFNSSVEPSLVVYLNEGGSIVPELEKDFEGETDIGGNIPSLGGYYNELKYFIQRIRDCKPLEVAPLSEGVKSVMLVLKEIDIAGGAKK
jgi:predicted dehydrogenase